MTRSLPTTVTLPACLPASVRSGANAAGVLVGGVLLATCFDPWIAPDAQSETSTSTSTSGDAPGVRYDLGARDVAHWPSCEGFICAFDVGHAHSECDVWAQDCPV